MAEMIYLANNDWLENLPELGAKDPALGAKIALVVTATGFVIVTVLLLFKCFKDEMRGFRRFRPNEQTHLLDGYRRGVIYTRNRTTRRPRHSRHIHLDFRV